LSFINPLFLIAIAGVALPVLIHLTREVKVKKVPFSSLMFLRDTPKELIRKRRLRDLFLLLIRSVLFALLALAFARPFFPRNKAQLIIGEEGRSMIILIDNSYSMQLGDKLDRARSEALKIIDEASGMDEMSLVFFSDEVQQISPLEQGKESQRHAINEVLKTTYRTTEFYSPLQLAEEILKEARNPGRQIIMISDFQNVGFGAQLGNWKLNPNVTFRPIKIVSEMRSNAFVNRFNLKQSRVGTRNAVEYKAEILTSQPAESEDCTVDLHVNDNQIDHVNVNPGQMNHAFFQQLDLREGFYRGSIRISDDDLLADNAYYFTYAVEPLPTLLCIDGSRSRPQSDSFFLRSVFNLGDESLYRFTDAGMNAITRDRLRSYDLVFLANSGSLSNVQLDAILDYVADGGNLIVSFGERMNLRQFSELLNRLGVGNILDQDMIQNPVLKNGFMGQIDFKHPIFSLFVQSGANELYRPRFRRFVQIEPDSNTNVISKFDTGAPFLIESRFSKGRVLTYTSTLNTKWTDFPIHDLYVPFLYELVKYGLSLKNDRTSFLVGETVPFGGNPGERWAVRGPDDEKYDIPIDEDGIGRFRETHIPGNYYSTSGDKRFWFSVNVDIRESDMQARDEEEVLVAMTKMDEEAQLDLAMTFPNDIKRDEKKQKVWLIVLVLVVALFIFETRYTNQRVGVKDKP